MISQWTFLACGFKATNPSAGDALSLHPADWTASCHVRSRVMIVLNMLINKNSLEHLAARTLSRCYVDYTLYCLSHVDFRKT